MPNPAVILYQIPYDVEWFTVIDLRQAFFSIPLHTDRVLAWCRVPQGYTESPSIFNQILKKCLESLVMPEDSVLVQYIDDLLVASKTREACVTDTIVLLNHLAVGGHKVSPAKLQFCQKEVLYLGHKIEKGVRKASQDRITVILQMNPPRTQKEV